MKIATINSIEISSLCDNACDYCPAPDQGQHRETGLMEHAVFEQAIGWVRKFAQAGTQRELNLFGVGEPTLHPALVDFVAYAREHLPARQRLHLNTNGNRMTIELARALKGAGIDSVDITAHKARAAARTLRIFRAAGIAGRISIDPITAPNNWAGQVDWFAPDYFKGAGMECPWLRRGQVMVMSSGAVTRCCIDAFGRGVCATLDDDLAAVDLKPFDLCRDCHHIP